MDRGDVVDLLTIVQMGDRRTIGDPDISFWLGMLGPYDREECCDAIEAHRREQPGVWLEPGHVIGRVRAMHRDRLDRMDPEERYEKFDREADYREKTGMGIPYVKRVESSSTLEAAPRGKYIEADPAGWSYGVPTSTAAWDADPLQRERLDAELDARIRVYRVKNPDCVSDAEAEHAIRLKDAEKASEVLRKLKRGELADLVGGAFTSPSTTEPPPPPPMSSPVVSGNEDVIDAEVVTLGDEEELF